MVAEMKMGEYAENLFENVLNQLHCIDYTLGAALNINEIEQCDQLIDDEHTVAWLNMKALDEMRKTLESMMDEPPKPNKTNNYAVITAIVGVTMIGSLLIYRNLL